VSEWGDELRPLNEICDDDFNEIYVRDNYPPTVVDCQCEYCQMWSDNVPILDVIEFLDVKPVTHGELAFSYFEREVAEILAQAPTIGVKRPISPDLFRLSFDSSDGWDYFISKNPQFADPLADDSLISGFPGHVFSLQNSEFVLID